MAPRGELMVGMARSIRGDQATGYEFLLLQVRDGKLVFTAHPSGQARSEFVSTFVSESAFSVENAEHDFPKRIEYERVSPDSLVARVYGEIGATEPAFSVHYVQTSCQ